MNDEVSTAFESLLLSLMKQLEASGNIKTTDELKEHVENVEAAKRRRGSLTGVISDVDVSDSDSMPNSPLNTENVRSVSAEAGEGRNSRITTEGMLRMVRTDVGLSLKPAANEMYLVCF